MTTGIGVHVCEGCGVVLSTIGAYLDHVESCDLAAQLRKSDS